MIFDDIFLQNEGELPADTIERVNLSFKLTFWSEIASILVILVTIFTLIQQRRAIRQNNREPKCFGLILPIYLPVLWALVCVFLLQCLILGIPGPYPNIPGWFLGAAYASPQGALWVSSVLYYFYWFAFELMSEGFAFLLLQPLPSPEAFAASLRWGMAYASLAAGLTTSGFVFAGSRLSTGAQLAIDGVFVSAPCFLYGTLLVTMMWPRVVTFFGCNNHAAKDGSWWSSLVVCSPFKRLLGAISSRRSFFPYILFSLAWRLVSLVLILSGKYSTPAGTSMTLLRTLVTPVIIYVTLVLDSRYWRNLATMALEGDEAIIVLSGASPQPSNNTSGKQQDGTPRFLSPGRDSVLTEGGSPPASSSSSKRVFDFFPASFASPKASGLVTAAATGKSERDEAQEDADADADIDESDAGDDAASASRRRKSSGTSGGGRGRQTAQGRSKRSSSIDSTSSADTTASSVASSVHSNGGGEDSEAAAVARMRERLRLAHEAAGLSSYNASTGESKEGGPSSDKPPRAPPGGVMKSASARLIKLFSPSASPSTAASGKGGEPGTTTAASASSAATAPKQTLMIVSRSGHVRPIAAHGGRLASVFLQSNANALEDAAAASSGAGAAIVAVADESTSLKSALLASSSSSNGAPASKSKLYSGSSGGGGAGTSSAVPSSHSRLITASNGTPVSISAVATGAFSTHHHSSSSSSGGFYQSDPSAIGVVHSVPPSLSKMRGLSVAANSTKLGAAAVAAMLLSSHNNNAGNGSGRAGVSDGDEPLFLPPTPASSGSLWRSFLAGLGIRGWCLGSNNNGNASASKGRCCGRKGDSRDRAASASGPGHMSSPVSYSGAALARLEGPPGIITAVAGSASGSSSSGACLSSSSGDAAGSGDGKDYSGLLRGRAASAIILAELAAEDYEAAFNGGSDNNNGHNDMRTEVPQSNPSKPLILDTIGSSSAADAAALASASGDEAFYGSSRTKAAPAAGSILMSNSKLAFNGESQALGISAVPSSMSALNSSRPKSGRLLAATTTTTVGGAGLASSNSVLLIKAPLSNTGLSPSMANKDASGGAGGGGGTMTTTMTSSGAVIRTNYRPELAMTQSKHKGGAGSGAVGEDVDSEDDAAVDAAAEEDDDADTETIVSSGAADDSWGRRRGGSPISLSGCVWWVREVLCCGFNGSSNRTRLGNDFGSPSSRVGRSRPATMTASSSARDGNRSRNSSRGRLSIGGISMQGNSNNNDNGDGGDEDFDYDEEEEEAEASDSSIDRLLLVDVGVSMAPKDGKRQQSRTKSKSKASAAAGNSKRSGHVPPSTGFTPASSFYQANSSTASITSNASAAVNAQVAAAARHQQIIQQQQQQKEVARAERLRSQVHSSLLIDGFLLEVGPFLDRGATSAVHAGKYRGKPVAIKMFRPERLTQHAISFLHSEHKLSAALRHPNVVRYHGLCVIPPHISLVFDYCARGSLYNLIEKLLLEREMYASYYGIAALEAYGVTGQLLPPYCDCHVHPPSHARGEARHPGYPCRRLLVRLSANGGSSLVEPPPPPSLSWRRRLRMARDGAAALAYLHNLSPPICSRDVKSQNLLVTLGYRLKLSDFGESRAVQPFPPWAPTGASGVFSSSTPSGATATSSSASASSSSGQRSTSLSRSLPAGTGASAAVTTGPLEPMTGEIGTIQWMAPEMMRADPYYYGPAIDVYSYGVVLWELATMQHPWEGVPQETVILATMRGRRLALPEDCPSSYARLVQACWDADPKKRPTSQQVLDKLQRLLDSWERKLARRKDRGRHEDKARNGSAGAGTGAVTVVTVGAASSSNEAATD